MGETNKAKADKKLFRSKVFSVWQTELSTNRKKSIFEYVSLNEAVESVIVLPITQDKKVILIEKYSPVLHKNILVLPGGKVEKNEILETTVKRELLEETGFISNKIQKLIELQILPGYLLGKTTAYLAENVVQKNKIPKDVSETINMKFLTFKQLKVDITNGKISDVRTIATILYYLFPFISKA